MVYFDDAGLVLTVMRCRRGGCAFSFLLFITRHSDKMGERFWHVSAPLLVGVVGFLMSMSTMSTWVRYLSM